MPSPVAIAALLLAAAQAPALREKPIIVTGNAWAPFISPMGEPFRPHAATDDTLADWFNQADHNRDGVLTPDEMEADAERFFAILDTNHDGVIDPDEIVHYEWQVAPDIQLGSRLRRSPGEKPPRTSPGAAHRGDQDGDELGGHHQDEHLRRSPSDSTTPGGIEGAARYGLLNIPEPVAAADTDVDRAITVAEFRQAALDRFAMLDTAHRGALTLQQLEAARAIMLASRKRARVAKDAPDDRYGAPLPPGD